MKRILYSLQLAASTSLFTSSADYLDVDKYF